MTPAERLGRPTTPTGPPHGRFGTVLRLALAMSAISTLVAPYFLLCVVLLPWRAVRLRLGNLFGGLAGRWVFRIVGLSYRVHGDSIADQRPAIYVQNHAGSLDLFLAMQLCPTPGSGTMKRSIVRVPILGLGYLLSGHLLLDRGDHDRAVKAMREVAGLVERSGISVWILPEGTRSADGRLLPFKKGFAHLALQTRLPIVPVVVHDGHLFWSRGIRVRPGEAQVEVLPAIPTTAWRRETLDDHIRSVEQVFRAHLADHQLPLPADGGAP